MAIYIKFGAISGEVTTKGYEKWIEVDSFHWGLGRAVSVGGGGGSKRESSAPSVSELVLTKTMSVDSPLLLKEAIGGKAADVKIELTQTDASGKHIAFQKYVLHETLVAAYSISSGGDRPRENFTLNFAKFDSEYVDIDSKFQTRSTGHVIYDIAAAKMG